MKYNGIVISDLHFGAFDTKILKNELYEVFIKYLYSLKKIDFIVISGDYFDHKLYLNDRTSDYSLTFMDTLINIAKDYNCPIRIIYGTESHECNQYNIFSVYENDPSVDFNIVYTICDEELRNGLNVLYIPEEYIYSKKEYYKEYFDEANKYDYIFGHGVIVEAMNFLKNRKTEEKESSKRRKVPHFGVKELIHPCKGQVFFGHYHINTNIDDKVFYVGSYSRWIFGEDEPKGFYHITCDTEKSKYKAKFIENSLARKFITYNYGYSSHVIDSEESLIKELEKRDKATEISNGDCVRYIFNIPENYPNPEFIMRILNERYKFNDSIKVKVVNGYVEKKKKVNKKRLNDVLEEYPMIFDKSVKIEDKIVYYIKKHLERDIPLDKVKEYLYDESKKE